MTHTAQNRGVSHAGSVTPPPFLRVSFSFHFVGEDASRPLREPSPGPYLLTQIYSVLFFLLLCGCAILNISMTKLIRVSY